MSQTPGINISVRDTTVSVQGGAEDSLEDVSNALHAELSYITEHHPSVIIEVDPFSRPRK